MLSFIINVIDRLGGRPAGTADFGKYRRRWLEYPPRDPSSGHRNRLHEVLAKMVGDGVLRATRTAKGALVYSPGPIYHQYRQLAAAWPASPLFGCLPCGTLEPRQKLACLQLNRSRAARGAAMTEKEWMECADSEELLANLPVDFSPRKWRLLSVACCRNVSHLLSDQSSMTALQVGESFADGELTVSHLHEAMEPAENAWEALFRITNTMVEQSTDIPISQFSEDELARCDLSGGRDTITVLGEEYRRLEAQEDAAMAAVRCVVHDPNATAIAVAYSTLRNVAMALATEELLATTRPKQDRMFLVLESIEWGTLFDRQRLIASANLSNIVRDIFGNPFRPVAFDPAWLTSTVKHLAEAIYEERAFDNLPILADALEEAGCNQHDILAHLRGGGKHCRGCWPLDLVLGKE